MSAIKDMFQNLNQKKRLPSAMERAGIRVPSDLSSEDIAGIKNFRDNSPEEYGNLMNEEIGNALKNSNIPEGTQLNLFATSGPEAFGNYLDSDAVTGMDLQELDNLDNQFALSNPEVIPEVANGFPELMEAVQGSNVQGMGAFNGLSPALGAVGKLSRLFAMLNER